MRLFRKLRTGREDKEALGRTHPRPTTENSTEGLFHVRDFNPPLALGKKVRIEVVAIHGLNGHPFSTWTSDNVIWFADLLPDLLPDFNLRVSTFGYNSAIAFGRSKFQLRDYATQLLTQLLLMRKSSNTLDVPIVFLCHSLGGIVFKKLLTVAHERKSTYQDISRSTRAVMFMGTPHIGSDLAKWTRVLRNMGNICTAGSIRTDLLKGLESKSAEFSELTAQFVERGDTLKIVSVYEGRSLALLLPVVVERESAVLNLSNETTLPVDADHREICRFSNAKDPRYSAVILALADLIKDAKVVESPGRKVCLDALYFPHYNARRLTVSEAHDSTLSWFWNHPQYEGWEQSQSSSLLWLQGKPGSGKSTLASYFRSQLGNKLAYIHDAHCVVADFFYSARGGDDQQGHLWMLRSILYQLLRQAPGLFDDLVEILEQDETSRHDFSVQRWSLHSLQSIFLSLGTKYNRGLPLRVYIIVDAMDESEEDKRQEIVQMLQRTSECGKESVVFKVFVASRPNPKIGYILRNCRYMKLEDETSNDIAEYVKSGVNEIAVDILHRYPHDLDSVAHDLINRSRGVFLWVKLVLTELREQALEGVCSIAEIEDLLRSIPSDLEDVYARIISKLERKGQAVVQDCQTFLRWVAFSPQPLALEELEEILAATLCGINELSEAEMNRHRVGSPEDMERRIISRCGNLLEVRDGPNPNDLHQRVEVVQFIHQTAREYCLTRMKSPYIQMDASASEIEIAALCKNYLTYFNSTINMDWKLPSTGADWTEGDLFKCVAMIRNHPTLIPFCLDSYKPYAMATSQSRSKLGEVIKDFLQTVELTFCVLESATLASLLLGHTQFLKSILRAPEQMNRLLAVPVDDERLVIRSTSSKLGLELESTRSLTALHVAVCLKFGSLPATQTLLDLGVDPTAVDGSGQTPLFQAMARGQLTLSQALFDTKAEDHFNHRDDTSISYDRESRDERVTWESTNENALSRIATPENCRATPHRSPSASSRDSYSYFQDQRGAHDSFNFKKPVRYSSPARRNARNPSAPDRKNTNPCIMDLDCSTAISKALDNQHYDLAGGVLVKAQALGLFHSKSPFISDALYKACREGDVHAFDVVADFATQWDFLDADNRTLMDVAREGGHEEIIFRLMLRMGQ